MVFFYALEAHCKPLESFVGGPSEVPCVPAIETRCCAVPMQSDELEVVSAEWWYLGWLRSVDVLLVFDKEFVYEGIHVGDIPIVNGIPGLLDKLVELNGICGIVAFGLVWVGRWRPGLRLQPSPQQWGSRLPSRCPW